MLFVHPPFQYPGGTLPFIRERSRVLWAMFDLLHPRKVETTWLLAQCRSGHEHIVADQVRSRDLARVFLPREMRRRLWRGRWQEFLRPVFPGYVFISPHAEFRNWRSLHVIRGFSRFVAFGDAGPARVPAQLVEAMRMRCDLEDVLQRSDVLEPGRNVRVLTGPFADTVARIESLEPEERAVLLIELMGRPVRASVSRSDLAPVERPDWTRH